MLTSLISGLILLQVPAELNAPILILGKSETEIDLSKLYEKALTVDLFEKEVGLNVHEINIEGRLIYVSERVAPLEGYLGTVKFLTDLLTLNDRKVESGSNLGKQLSEYFKSFQPYKSFDEKPEDQCYNVFLHIEVSDPSGQREKTSLPIGMQPPKNAPLRKNLSHYDPNEANKVIRHAQSHQAMFPNTTSEASYVVTPLTVAKPKEAIVIENLAVVGQALNKIGQEVRSLQLRSAQLYEEALTRMVSEIAPGLSLKNKEFRLSELPPEIADQIRRSILASYEMAGPDELAAAKQFLDGDPRMNLKVRLAAVQMYTPVRKDGTIGDPTGVVAVFGDPNAGKGTSGNPPP